ncbi:MAG: hypothetical protein LAO08_11085 [Acidobacteriia bacterium]|nr:hypothetical protein [Terriglobia bacterium]
MKKNLRAPLGLLVAFLLFSVAAFAHHGGSEYDTKNLVTLKGTVTEFHWANPHCQVFVDVKDNSGKVVNWAIETLAPAVLKRAGWSKGTLQTGDQISITFAPSVRGTPVGMIRKVVLPSGKELTGGSIGELPSQ